MPCVPPMRAHFISMANTPHQSVTKSWVHEPEKLAEARAAKFARIARIGEVPTILGGIALVVVGRRLGGNMGRAVSAAGATVSLGAGKRIFTRLVLSRLRGTAAEPIPS